MKRRKKTIIFLMPVFAFIILYFIGYAYKFFKKIFVFPCMINMITGYYCCGCGGTRSFYALLEGDIINSLKYNPIVLFGVILLFLRWIEIISDKKIIPKNGFFWYSVLGIFLIFYIARNFIPWLAPI